MCGADRITAAALSILRKDELSARMADRNSAFIPPGLTDTMTFLHACAHTLIIALVPLVHLCHVLTVLVPLFVFFWTVKPLGAGTLVYYSNGLHDIRCLLKLT